MQKLQLSIPEPCHENWHNMTPTGQGRYCNACAKEVVDFSMMTDTEVLNYFTTLTHENVCGRTLPSQLGRDISKPKEPKKRLFWYWNYIVMFFMFFSKSDSTKAQGGIRRVITETVPQKNNDVKLQPDFLAGDIVIAPTRVVTGRVTDKDSNAVSFATIKIKGSKTGLSADADGRFTLRLKNEDVLSVTGATFKESVITVGEQKKLDIVLDKSVDWPLNEVVVGGMLWSDGNYNTPSNQKLRAQLQVKDEETGKPVDKARIIVVDYDREDTVYTDRKGKYKLKGIRRYGQIFIKVDAEGYEANEFTISYSDIEVSNREWEVLLSKQTPELLKVEGAVIRSVDNVTPGNEVRIRMGSVSNGAINKKPLYVMDGIIMSDMPDINPEDVDDYSVLQAPAAVAVFGPDGENGAIVITTRKAKEKNLDTVTVSSVNNYLRGRLGGVRVRTTITGYSEVITRIHTILTDSLKIYPNPVQHGNVFSVSLKLKQPGTYYIQIADATGRIVLQKQISAAAKDHSEKIPTDNRWTGGIYYIRVYDNNNKPISKNSFIVQ